MSEQEPSKVFPGKVEVVCMPSGRYFARIRPKAGGHGFTGLFRNNREHSLRDAAEWLEARGFTHPETQGDPK